MKRLITVTLALLGVATMMTSCLKDEDKDLFRHPIHVQGEIDPHFGLPLASGEITINDMLGMLSDDFFGYLDTTGDVMVFYYQDSIEGSIDAGGSLTGAKGVGTKGTLFSKDTTFSFGTEINLFDNVVDQIFDAGVQLDHLYLTYNAWAQGDCPDNVRESVRQNVKLHFDSLSIDYVDHNGVSKHYSEQIIDLSEFNDPTKTLLDYHQIDNTVDLKEIANDLPRYISASITLRLELEDTIVSAALAGNANFDELLDSIGVTTINYGVNFEVRLPLDIRIGNLPYTFDLNIGDGLANLNIDSIINFGDNVELNLKESSFILACENGIPFDLRLNGLFLDANDLPLDFNLVSDTIGSAPTAPNASGVYQSIAFKSDTVAITLDKQKLQKMQNAKKLRLTVAMATDPNNGGNPVAVRKTDKLRLKAYLKVWPAATVDIPITNKPILSK